MLSTRLERERAAALHAAREQAVRGAATFTPVSAAAGDRVGEVFTNQLEPTDMPAAIGVPSSAPQETRYRRVRLVVAGVPASKIADANN